jgi:hypothetical protein
MALFQTIRLRSLVFLIRTGFRLSNVFRGLFGTRPYYTNFPPNRFFNINSSTSQRTIKINVYEPSGFDKENSYPVHINLHGELMYISWSLLDLTTSMQDLGSYYRCMGPMATFAEL